MYLNACKTVANMGHKHALIYTKKAVWDMRKRGSGHQNKGTEGREMGFIGLITHPKSGKTGEKDNPFWQFSGHRKRHHIQVKNMENHNQFPLSRHCIEYRLPTHCNYLSLHFHNDFPATTEPLCNALKICICVCICKK